MPVRLDLEEEAYAPTGGIGGEGQRKVLGRPTMGVLTLLAREALQNSWDARASPQGPITFMVDAWSLKQSELRTAREQVFAETPEGLPLRGILERGSLDVICISDRGTRGLVGPTRADQLEVGSKERNFVAFIRDVGRAASADVEGGTYGFGKASFYVASTASTICVHTRIRDARGQLEDRFIAAGVGAQHNATVNGRRVRRTGRCWWGRRSRDGHVDPVTGRDAEIIARALGMPAFERSQTGTSILVIAPDLSVDIEGEVKERSLEQAVRRLVSDLVWFAWPRMVAGRTGNPAIMFEARVRNADGAREIPIPDPVRFPPLSCFVEMYRLALQSIQEGRMADGRCTPIKRYQDIIGWLALGSFGVLQRSRLDTGDQEDPAWVGMPCRHVALMRGPRLIVKYLEGPPLPNDILEYAGVFISKEHVEEAFAMAEPPTHDDWIPQTVADPLQRSQVRVALQKVKEEMQRFVGRLGSAEVARGGLWPLGGFSESLGRLLTEIPGNGRPQVPPPPDPGGQRRTGGGPRPPRATVRQLEEVEYAVIGGKRVVVIPFQVFPVPGTHGTRIRASAKVSVADGDQERDPPEGAVVPEVVAWLRPNGDYLAERTDVVDVPAYEHGVWKVQISVPDDAPIMVDLNVE